MPIFQYKAIAPGGDVRTGVIDADTARDARTKLRQEKLLVSDIRESSGRRARRRDFGDKQSWLSKLRTTRSQRTSTSSRDLDLVTGATRQLGTMLGSGIPMTEALRALIDQAEDRRS